MRVWELMQGGRRPSGETLAVYDREIFDRLFEFAALQLQCGPLGAGSARGRMIRVTSRARAHLPKVATRARKGGGGRVKRVDAIGKWRHRRREGTLNPTRDGQHGPTEGAREREPRAPAL